MLLRIEAPHHPEMSPVLSSKRNSILGSRKDISRVNHNRQPRTASAAADGSAPWCRSCV